VPHFKTSRRVAVSSDIAFEVASNVAAYKDFLPLLEGSVIRGTPVDHNGVKSFNAELTVGYAKLNLRETFISQVVCDAAVKTVTATSQEAPFKHMKTMWSINSVNGQSNVTISIDYAMRSMLLQFAIAGAMEMAVNKIMSAFETRAKQVYNSRITS
jgi:coenzyme Q-binding protein COQ10